MYDIEKFIKRNLLAHFIVVEIINTSKFNLVFQYRDYSDPPLLTNPTHTVLSQRIHLYPPNPHPIPTTILLPNFKNEI